MKSAIFQHIIILKHVNNSQYLHNNLSGTLIFIPIQSSVFAVFSQDLCCDKKTFPSIISDSEILLMLSSTASDRLSEFEHVGHCEETLFADKPFCSRHSSERKALTSFGFVAQAYNIFSRIPCNSVNTRHFALSAMSD